MAGNPDDYRFKPGEAIRYYDWTPEEVLAAKKFILERDPPLWEALKAVEQDPNIETFAGTDEYIRVSHLLNQFHPQWQAQQISLGLWRKLRALWRSEVAGNPDDYRFKPGEAIRFYDWTPEEVLAAKKFVLERDPPLWEALKALEQDPDLETFALTDEDIRLNRLIKRLYPRWEGQQLGNLWGKLRALWRSEIAAEKTQ